MLQYILKITRDKIIMMKNKHSDQICFQRVRFITTPREEKIMKGKTFQTLLTFRKDLTKT